MTRKPFTNPDAKIRQNKFFYVNLKQTKQRLL